MIDQIQMTNEHLQFSSLSGLIVSKGDEVDRHRASADRGGSAVPLARRREDGCDTSPPTVTMPVIPPWGPAHSGKRVETEPVAKFTFARNSTSTEIMFNPPMYQPLERLC